jgi:hypothetical protein
MPAGLLIAAVALLSLAVYSYPLPPALRPLRAQVQEFQRILNTKLISYFSLIFHFVV